MKLDLLSKQGTGYNANNTYATSFNIINYDTNSVALSALRVVSYGWLQNYTYENYTSSVESKGTITNSNGGSSEQAGIIALDTVTTTYRINHNSIDTSIITPQLTIKVPASNSEIPVVSFSNNTSTYFDIILDSPVPTLSNIISK